MKDNDLKPKLSTEIKRSTLFFCIMLLSVQLLMADARLTIKTKDGRMLPLVPEPLDTFTEIPLKKTRNSLNKKHNNLEFFSLYMLKVKAGQPIIANLHIREKPKRVTAAVMFQPLEEGSQYVKVVGSGYFQAGTNVSVEGVVPAFSEIIVLFIADATKNPDHLPENIKKIFEDEFGEVIITDLGTDWSMSDIEVTFKTKEKQGNTKKESTIVFEDEIEKLYAPQWLMTVRLIIEK